MKRPMFLACAISLALGSTATLAQQKHKAGSTYCHQNPEACQAERSGNGKTADSPKTGGPGTERAMAASTGKPAYYQANLKPFFPADTIFATKDSVGKHCDEQGNYTESAKFRCKEYVSPSTNTSYRARFSKEGDRVFTMVNGRPVLYVHMEGGRDLNRVVYKSAAAQQVAAANGYRFDDRNSTMAAVNAPTETKTALNCKSPQSANEHLACAKQHGGPVATPAAKPAPSPAPQTVDCSKLGMIQRIKCEAQNAAATATK